MAPPRRRNLVRSRRRIGDEGEEEGSTAGDLADGSQSDGSGLSDDADYSDLSDTEEGDHDGREEKDQPKTESKLEEAGRPATNGEAREPPVPAQAQSTAADGEASFAKTADTVAMTNGLRAVGQEEQKTQGDVVGFEATTDQVNSPGQTEAMQQAEKETDEERKEDTGPEADPKQAKPNGKRETLSERRRREHEEYKKKRDSDPAFIPNRGAFFMHDQRSANAHDRRPHILKGKDWEKGPAGSRPFSPAQ